MRALAFKAHGGLDQLELLDLPEPTPAANEVVVQVAAAALNRLDLFVLAGWPGLNVKLPHVLGSDGSGIVSRIGSGVTSYSPGDRVAVNPTLCNDATDYFAVRGLDHMCNDFAIIGEHVDGFYSDFAAVPERNLLTLPDDVAFETAAAASLVYVTAWHSLIKRGRLQAGESMLIIGAGGGVNTASIQIANLAGAAPIIVVGSSDEKLATATQLGADITINRNDEDWSKAVYKTTGRRGVDVVVDNVGAATFANSLRALKRGGRLLTVGNTSGPKFEFDNRFMFARHLSIIGSTMGTSADYAEVMRLVFEGRLNPVIDTVYPMEQAIEALQRLETGDVTGKIVLSME